MNASLTMLNPWGKYLTIDKQFADDNHLSNYIKMMQRKGYKVVSTHVLDDN